MFCFSVWLMFVLGLILLTVGHWEGLSIFIQNLQWTEILEIKNILKLKKKSNNLVQGLISQRHPNNLGLVLYDSWGVVVLSWDEKLILTREIQPRFRWDRTKLRNQWFQPAWWMHFHPLNYFFLSKDGFNALICIVQPNFKQKLKV